MGTFHIVNHFKKSLGNKAEPKKLLNLNSWKQKGLKPRPGIETITFDRSIPEKHFRGASL